VGDVYFDKIRQRNSASAADTDGGGVTATISDPGDGKKLVCTGLQASGDAAALVTVESPSGTVLWRKRFSGAFTMSETFVIGTIVGGVSEAMLAKVSASTTNSEVNIQAVTVAG
jgi:hypothetical protein